MSLFGYVHMAYDYVWCALRCFLLVCDCVIVCVCVCLGLFSVCCYVFVWIGCDILCVCVALCCWLSLMLFDIVN